MKQLAVVFILSFLLVSPVFASPDSDFVNSKDSEKEIKSPIRPHCPATKISDNDKCSLCHVMVKEGGKVKYGLKEINPFDRYTMPSGRMRMVAPDTIYFLLTDIDGDFFADAYHYVLMRPEIKRLILEMQSPGGSMMEAWRIVGLMDTLKASGIEVETRCHGFAASAGFMVFINGSRGNRKVSPTAELMWHELISFKFFSIETPSDKEEESRVLRHFQDNCNRWMAGRCNLTKEDLDAKIKKKEFWMTGKEAAEYGFADSLIKSDR